MNKMIAVIDYGVGNLFSLAGSLKALGLEASVTSDPEVIKAADRIILPGVGAFPDAANKLSDTGLVPVLKSEIGSGKPLLGICLGMQLLFEKSYEYGEHNGLGFLKGSVCPLRGDISPELSVPHMGWNRLVFKRTDDPLLKYNTEGDYVYFVHSFYVKDCEESLTAYAEYDVHVPAVVHKGSVYGTQFHPEKSGSVGLKMLRAFSAVKLC